MLAFLEEGSLGAKSRCRQQWRYYGSHRTSDNLKLGLGGVQRKILLMKQTGSIKEDWDALLKSLDFPVRKCEGHGRVISKRLVAREAKGSCEVLNLDSSSGTGEKRQ